MRYEIGEVSPATERNGNNFNAEATKMILWDGFRFLTKILLCSRENRMVLVAKRSGLTKGRACS